MKPCILNPTSSTYFCQHSIKNQMALIDCTKSMTINSLTLKEIHMLKKVIYNFWPKFDKIFYSLLCKLFFVTKVIFAGCATEGKRWNPHLARHFLVGTKLDLSEKFLDFSVVFVFFVCLFELCGVKVWAPITKG